MQWIKFSQKLNRKCSDNYSALYAVHYGNRCWFIPDDWRRLVYRIIKSK